MAEGKVRTPDMGGTNSTTDMAEAVLQQAEKHRE
jgi:isocitrate/isopropylmalate dehydrogenase